MNTELKKMNIEELDLVTGGLSGSDIVKVVGDTLKSNAPEAFIKKTANDIEGTCIKIGVDTARVVVPALQKAKQWLWPF